MKNKMCNVSEEKIVFYLQRPPPWSHRPQYECERKLGASHSLRGLLPGPDADTERRGDGRAARPFLSHQRESGGRCSSA